MKFFSQRITAHNDIKEHIVNLKNEIAKLIMYKFYKLFIIEARKCKTF